MQDLTQQLYVNTDNTPSANRLAALLEQYKFTGELNDSLAQLKTKLESNDTDKLSEEDYLAHPDVKTAMEQLNAAASQMLIPGLLRIWWNQKHQLSAYEKIFFTLSALTLTAAAILTREIFVILLDGKPKLKATGTAIMDYCTTGLSDDVVDTCAFLDNGQTAVFDLNRRTVTVPTFLGNVSDPLHGPTPVTSLQEIPGWINSLGWIQYFTCTQQDNTTTFVGHYYANDLPIAKEKASLGFPVEQQLASLDPDFEKSYFTLKILSQAFLAVFCIKIQNGGYSTFTDLQGQPYGHFDGFERTGDDFQRNTYIFASVYGGLAGIAFLTMSALLINKAKSKWVNSSDERKNFSVAKEASALFKKINPTPREITSSNQSEHSLSNLESTQPTVIA